VLEQWIAARGETPLPANRRAFACSRCSAKRAGVPSFNACRETCREIAYHYNLLSGDSDPGLAAHRRRMMEMLVRHLLLFVTGKMQVEGLGEFCCASRPLRLESAQNHSSR
jgi:ribosomal protein S14